MAVTLEEAAWIEELAATYEDAQPEDILREALRRVPNITFACSFGAEDMVILDMLMSIDPQADVFYLDTNVLFPETYELIEQAVAKYGIPNLHQVLPKLTLAEQAAQYGDALWSRNPNQCCKIRKVEPLADFLVGYDGWITGIRREQAPTRRNAKVFEWDAKFNIIKVNPLVRWTEKDVWNYIVERGVPYNPLHDRNYPSIGCLHCTRPVKPGEDPRSGRWAGFDKTECGLHADQ
ncbi:phosphoadenylyl-sulfate reductase [Alicyclobacillus mali]|uniref:Adenosine 5'-phosphosulfate reductase n=1 Tax=Alicyclobacillus mali (ex Roth et al. 2021) TaxID=1123961 RepID=A0ABS0F3R6_9BACL|nr:phosphoadenylyl-sulfate reductase [Alicyclobacillus mali (ex Roth et al. 2021)]MBF8377945.1 phosphoadenylyl-sulfate reductase [Alicyclobacillus mali (ex Roth et al. 2021)]MCL6487684.1 phosphoadenylyl-sulfate reductase [Alicyclobacillus mali (ex Roth et al. 2021)]